MKNKVIISLSSPLLSRSLNELLRPFLPDDFLTIVDKEQESPKSVDIVVTDFTNLNSSDFLNRFPGAKILLIDTGLNNHEKRLAVLLFDIKGILENDTSPEYFFKAIERVRRDELLLDHEIFKEIIRFYRNGSTNKVTKKLTRREREIILLVCRGCDNKEIANELGIRVPTVKIRLTHIFRKFNVSSRTQLQAHVLQNGVLDWLKYPHVLG